MPTARSSGAAVVHDGKIYVAGGRLPRGSDFAVYDPAADTWEVLPTELPDMPMPVHGIAGSAFVDGLIRVTGGGVHIGGSSGSTMNQVYRPAVPAARRRAARHP